MKCTWCHLLKIDLPPFADVDHSDIFRVGMSTTWLGRATYLGLFSIVGTWQAIKYEFPVCRPFIVGRSCGPRVVNHPERPLHLLQRIQAAIGGAGTIKAENAF